MKKSQLIDEQLVRLHQNSQSGEGFELLYTRYFQKVYQKCLTMTGDREDAKDITQDIFLKVFEKLNAFQYRSSFSTWLYSLSRNHCVDILYRNKRMQKESLSTYHTNQLEDGLAESSESKFRLMTQLLQQLPEPESTLLTLKYEQGLSIKQLSQYYQIDESAVKMRLKRSRDKLRARYNQLL